MSAFCNNCGSALPPGARFCSVCGNVIAGFPPAGFPPYAPRLVRPIFGRQFAGVCVGLARTYGWDVGLVRILAVISGIFLCPFPEIFYIACWIGIPEEQIQDVPPPPQP
ncbi:PspC domain-containing protein [Acidicapsa acidisoli]|uniref:PspC domain-containing protein n=1 Tax=Acidicapsa acidisoli TaxID=1615681 RepID=UPI0021E0D191|nr:PspC domain-containing protein [Acidicapsa acidisoli]